MTVLRRRHQGGPCGVFSPDTLDISLWETAVQQEVPAEVLARVSAYDWLVSLGAMPLGYALGPALTREFGYTWPLAGAAVLVLIALAVPVSLPDVRNLRLRHAPADGNRVGVSA
jgi:hypothetical protein